MGLDRGGVNLRLTFSDGNTTEFALSNANYDNFESGMTDTFTLILPFGYTPFDITEYTIAVCPTSTIITTSGTAAGRAFIFCSATNR